VLFDVFWRSAENESDVVTGQTNRGHALDLGTLLIRERSAFGLFVVLFGCAGATKHIEACSEPPSANQPTLKQSQLQKYWLAEYQQHTHKVTNSRR
jgi:hypothetical protein